MGVDKRITIREDQDEWLDDNDWFNLSGHVRDSLDEVIQANDSS